MWNPLEKAEGERMKSSWNPLTSSWGLWWACSLFQSKGHKLRSVVFFVWLISRLWEQMHFITPLVLGTASLVLKTFQTLLATLNPFPLPCKDTLGHFLQLSNLTELPLSSSFEIGSQAGTLRSTQPASCWTVSSVLLWSANLGSKWKSEAEISLMGRAVPVVK